jgi:hypothetical protein
LASAEDSVVELPEPEQPANMDRAIADARLIANALFDFVIIISS